MKKQVKTQLTNKKAVSLIVLVITIIVMVILAGTIILTISNTGIMEKAEDAVEQTNLAEVQTLASLKWAEAFLDGNTTTQQLKTEVESRLVQEGIDLTKYNLEITDEGVIVSLKAEPDGWVVATVDGVPIPKGFTASSATGENTKNGGLVIYEGTEPVTNDNVETAKRTRNQYVWVPVPKDEFTTKFVRQKVGSTSSISISNQLGTDIWEVILDTTTNMPLATQDSNYMTSETLAEVQAMYESVKEYEGFYIARYEAGMDVESPETSSDGVIKNSVHSKMNKEPYSYVRWTYNNRMDEDTNGAVEMARSVYPKTNTNYGVVSTLTYGVQWDRTLAWWLEVGAKDGKGNTITSLTDSTSYGNYSNHVIAAGDLNDGAKYAETGSGSYQPATQDSTKASGTTWALTTGALKVAEVNNIYDMAGNVYEWTMEGGHSNYRIARGGYYNHSGSERPVSLRGGSKPNNEENTYVGFRPTLYIKK